jgi:3-hydroxyacyl-CoA dehydrogenase
MRFASVARRGALAEIVRGSKTSDGSVTRAIDLACRLGLIPIVSRDLTGCYTVRVSRALHREAELIAAEGAGAALVRNIAAGLAFARGLGNESDAVATTAGEPVEVRDRLLFSGSLEAVRCLEDGTVDSARDANLGSLLGLGFPTWTGGALQFINSYGVRGFTERADGLADAHGERFRPPALLRAIARRDDAF